MSFFLSPGVYVTERDLTNIIPAVATSIGGFAGAFPWGPVLDPTLISSENLLVSRFGKPTDENAASFFTAANFLSYTNNLQLVRVDTNMARNAVVMPTGTVTEVEVLTGGSGHVTPVVTFAVPLDGEGDPIEGGIAARGRVIMEAGVVTAVEITYPGLGYITPPIATITDADLEKGGILATLEATIVTGGIKINNETYYLEQFMNGNGVVGEFAAKYPGSLGNSLAVSIADSATYADWYYKGEFDSAPSTTSYTRNKGGTNDELHIVVIDALGLWTGSRGAILEKFAYVSKASDARKVDGANNYYKDVINNSSKYIWWMDHPESGTNWGTPALETDYVDLSAADDITAEDGGLVLEGGVDDLQPTDGQLMDGFSIFQNAELIDISLIPTGKVSATVAKYIIQQVAETRMDCVAFVSPYNITTGEMITGWDAAEQTVAFRTDSSFNVSSSYGVLDSGFKYQYDRYNDVYRWVPLNGDIAGLCARTDYTNDPWWSPGGLNRGQIKNVVKLAFNPNKTERDELYKNGINPVVSFPGQGIVLFGDKTLLSRPSAFDRINVRRLFIVLEKAIATAAKYQLFEFNDEFTRAQFRSMVEPFLRDVQGRRGVYDFRVVCDETNNTGEVIDRNEFMASIYIKPARSINFINLDFVAVRTGVSFEEIGG